MPECIRFVGGFSGEENTGGTKDAPTGYIAPLGTEILDPNIVLDFEYVLVLGTLEEIRKAAELEAKPTGLPTWTFNHDRQSWSYSGARDHGWPIEGGLRVQAEGPSPTLVSPVQFWRAEEAGLLAVSTEGCGEETRLRACWRRHGQEKFDEESIELERSSDVAGEFVGRLAGSPAYVGGMLQLRMELPGQVDGLVVKSIRLLP